MARRWTCRKCGYLNNRTSSRKCGFCGDLTKPKLRVPRHAVTLRDDSYEVYELLSETIHGSERGACAVCGKPQPEPPNHHQRDHDHRTGKPRGLACVRCNKDLLSNRTLEEARAVVAYLERVESYYAVALAGEAG